MACSTLYSVLIFQNQTKVNSLFILDIYDLNGEQRQGREP